MSATHHPPDQPGENACLTPVRNFPGKLLLVISAAILPYLHTLWFGFVYDDDVQVLGNPAIRSWHFVPAYFVKPVAGFFANIASARYYRPVFFLWLRLNYFLWNTHAWGWHLANIALHAAASVLVLCVLRRYFQDGRWALVGALVFAAHPVHVETVAWVSGCTDALMTVSLLGSLYLWVKMCESPSLVRRFGSWLCCALALLSKETAIVLPAIIFFHALAGIPAQPPGHAASGNRLIYALRQFAPYLGLAVIYLAVRHWILQGVSGQPHWISPAQALLTVPSLVLFYASHLIWPFKLSLFYDFPMVSRASSALLWLLLLLFMGIVAGTWTLTRRSGNRRLALAALWFLLPLAPVLYVGLFQRDDFVHDRYLYLPVQAVSVLTGMVGQFLSRPALRQTSLPRPLIIMGALVVFLAVITVLRAQPWNSNLSLYTNAVQVAPKNSLARNNLASQYAARGRYDEANALLKPLLEERPDLWLANYNYGFIAYRQGNLALAEEYLRRAIQIDPNDPDEYIYLGTTYFKQGRLLDASEQVRQGIARKPDGAGYHFTLGIIETQLGHLVAAKEEMSTELAYHPENAAAQAQLQAIAQRMAIPE